MEFFKSLQILGASENGIAIIWDIVGCFLVFLGLPLLLSFILMRKKFESDKKFFYLCDVMALVSICVGCGIFLSSRYIEVYGFLAFRYLLTKGENSFSESSLLIFMAIEAIALCLLYLIIIRQYILRKKLIYINEYFLYGYVLLYILVGALLFFQAPISEIDIDIVEIQNILKDEEMLGSTQSKLNYMVYTTQLSIFIYFPTLLGNYIRGNIHDGAGETSYVHVFSYLLFIVAYTFFNVFG